MTNNDTLQIRLPEELKKKAEKIAKRKHLTVAQLIRKLLRATR